MVVVVVGVVVLIVVLVDDFILHGCKYIHDPFVQRSKLSYIHIRQCHVINLGVFGVSAARVFAIFLRIGLSLILEQHGQPYIMRRI